MLGVFQAVRCERSCGMEWTASQDLRSGILYTQRPQGSNTTGGGTPQKPSLARNTISRVLGIRRLPANQIQPSQSGGRGTRNMTCMNSAYSTEILTSFSAVVSTR